MLILVVCLLAGCLLNKGARESPIRAGEDALAWYAEGRFATNHNAATGERGSEKQQNSTLNYSIYRSSMSERTPYIHTPSSREAYMDARTSNVCTQKLCSIDSHPTGSRIEKLQASDIWNRVEAFAVLYSRDLRKN